MEKWSAKLSGKSSLDGLLPGDFFGRATLEVARDLLGKVILVRERGRITAGRIVETEAYCGDDPASHCSRGLTQRCAPMFEKPGRAYVYFIYGMYEMLNFVTEPEGTPGAVLIRAVEPVAGLERIKKRRQGLAPRDWSNGPGRLTRALGIRMADNRQPLTGPRLFVVDDGYEVSGIQVSPRVGIRLGTEKPWRFFIGDHPHVSRVAENRLARRLK